MSLSYLYGAGCIAYNVYKSSNNSVYSFTGGTDEESVGEQLAKWFEKESNTKIDTKKYSCIGVYKDDILSGVIIYVNYTGHNVDLHVYLPRCLKRSVIKEMFEYPFVTAKVSRLTAKVPETSKKIRKILIQLGFILETKLKNYCPNGEDLLIYVAYKNNIQKWVK